MIFKKPPKTLLDQKRRSFFNNNEPMFLVSKLFLDIKSFNFIAGELENNPLKQSRFKNRCIFSGTSSSVYAKFRASRHQFRLQVFSGLATGVKKAS